MDNKDKEDGNISAPEEVNSETDHQSNDNLPDDENWSLAIESDGLFPTDYD